MCDASTKHGMPGDGPWAHCCSPPSGAHIGTMLQFLNQWMPYDLEETNTEYIITMPLPGCDVKEIEVSVKGSAILIEAHHKEQPPAETANVPERRKIVNMGDYLWNRPSIEVEIPIQEEVVPEKVKAKLYRGLLYVHFEKQPKKTIPITEDQK